MNLQRGKFGSGPGFRVASLWSVTPVTVRLTRVKQHSPGRVYVTAKLLSSHPGSRGEAGEGYGPMIPFKAYQQLDISHGPHLLKTPSPPSSTTLGTKALRLWHVDFWEHFRSKLYLSVCG